MKVKRKFYIMTTLVEGKTKLIQKGNKPFTINMIAKDF